MVKKKRGCVCHVLWFDRDQHCHQK